MKDSVSQTGRLLAAITELSHEFGTPLYVRGGGGNTSVKNRTSLWVKPSGTTLAGLTPEAFVAMSRSKLSRLYAIEPPAEPSRREALVKEVMTQAVKPGSKGRPSVEAPLHESLGARYVVHTHPALVNGMTCARDGRAVCQELFPEALWLDYIDPGYTLCMEVRKAVQAYAALHGHEPHMIFLKNHGIFASADTPEDLRSVYASIFHGLEDRYRDAGVPLDLPVGPSPSPSAATAAKERIAEAMERPDLCVCASGLFELTDGPVSPDHIVYARSFPLVGEPTQETVSAYRERYGCDPQVIAWDGAVYGVGTSDKKAALALELAQDGALVRQLARAFGGVAYMTDRQRQFIEQWEVESYRSQQIQ